MRNAILNGILNKTVSNFPCSLLFEFLVQYFNGKKLRNKYPGIKQKTIIPTRTRRSVSLSPGVKIQANKTNNKRLDKTMPLLLSMLSAFDCG
jgi:hypothetical protein